MTKRAPGDEEPKDADGSDVRALHKGALANLAGHAARFAQPLLLLAVTRLYGPSEFGLFVSGQAAYQILAKTSLLGLERGMLFWVPRATTGGLPLSIRPALLRVLGAALLLTLLSFGLAPVFAGMKSKSAATWLLMALGLAPLALMELLIHATVGRRRMDVQVGVRDVIVPLATLSIAIALHLAGAAGWGLGAAFALGNWVGFGAALWASIRIFGAGPLLRDTAPMPEALRRFALPQWGSELTTALVYNLDRIVLTAFASQAVVGAYGVALQFGNTIRSLRGTFDPLVSAVAASIASEGRKDRLDRTLAYAIRVVMLLQAPVAALFLFTGGWLIQYFGEGFHSGYGAIVIFSVGWTVHGVLGLGAPVLGGFGASRLLLRTALFALALEALLLVTLVPPFGAEGAAISIVGALIAQAALQYGLLSKRLGMIPGRSGMRAPIAIVAGASLLGLVAYAAAEAVRPGAGPIAGFVGFALGYLPRGLPALRPTDADRDPA